MNKLKNYSTVDDTDGHEVYRKYWFVLETRMHHEKKVRAQLEDLNIECFLPSQIVERAWKYRKKKIEQLLLPMKVFVHISKQDKLKVLQLSSVYRFMYDRVKLDSVIIPDDQMSQFMLMLRASSEEVQFCEDDMEPGVRVRVKSGPLSGLDGCVICQNGRSRFKIEVSVFGSVCVEISKDDIEKL